MAKSAKRLRWSKAALGEWHGYEVNNVGTLGTEAAVAARTGSHLDNYPWDWYFTTYGLTLVPSTLKPCTVGKDCPNPRIHRRQHAGTTDTLRAAKAAVEENLASASDDENAPAASTPVKEGDEVMPNALV